MKNSTVELLLVSSVQFNSTPIMEVDFDLPQELHFGSQYSRVVRISRILRWLT